MKLDPEYKTWPKRMSTWFEAAAIALFTLITVAPDAITSAYLLLPPDVRTTIPQEWIKWVGIFLIACGSISKIIQQPGLAHKGEVQGGSGADDGQG